MDEEQTLIEQVNNVNVKRLAFDRWTIEGYSRAAVQSFWRIPELKLGFDLGAHPWEFMGTPTWFISHTHLDHIAALPVYVARRRMMKMDPPTIYVPAHSVYAIQQVLDAFSRLDRGRLPCELIGVEAGDEIKLSRELVATVHRTYHTIRSVGYVVWERRQKLKPEFEGKAGTEIRDLRLSGVEVTRETRLPIVAYLGDSTPRGLDENPEMYQAKILISELTFLSPHHRKEKIHKNGHMHLDDYIERADRFENEIIVAGHVSTRYSVPQAQRLAERGIPESLRDRLHLWL